MIDRMIFARRRSLAWSAPTFILKWLKPAATASFVSRATFSSVYPRRYVDMKLRRCFHVKLRTEPSSRGNICRVPVKQGEFRDCVELATDTETHPSSSTLASRSFFPASCSLSIAKASSFVIASEMYRNAADRTSSSWRNNTRSAARTPVVGVSYPYGCKVCHEFPERLLPGAGVHVPYCVVHRPRCDMDNTLFGANP